MQFTNVTHKKIRWIVVVDFLRTRTKRAQQSFNKWVHLYQVDKKSPVHYHKLRKINQRSRLYSAAVEASAWFFNAFHLLLETLFFCCVKESKLAKFLFTMAKILSSKEDSWWTTRNCWTSLMSLIFLFDSELLMTWIVTTPDFFSTSNMSYTP